MALHLEYTGFPNDTLSLRKEQCSTSAFPRILPYIAVILTVLICKLHVVFIPNTKVMLKVNMNTHETFGTALSLK